MTTDEKPQQEEAAKPNIDADAAESSASPTEPSISDSVETPTQAADPTTPEPTETTSAVPVQPIVEPTAATPSVADVLNSANSMVESVTDAQPVVPPEPTSSTVQPQETTEPLPAKSEPPAVESPATESPATESPATESPATESPATESPATESPATESPATESPATESPAVESPAVESPAVESPAVETAATESESVPTGSVNTPASGGDSTADRIREKLGSNSVDRPVGNVDVQTQRPETPTGGEAIEIPDTDELDSALEAEISSALGEETAPAAAQSPSDVDSAEEASVASSKGASAEAEEIGPGSRVSGVIQHIHGDDVFLNAGLMADVLVSLKQFPESKPAVAGASLEVVIESIDADGLIRARLPQARTKSRGNWDGLAVGQVVDCQVTGTNKGGLQVTVSNLKAFLPASQVDLGFVSDMQQFVGQKLTVQITEVNPKKRNLVVSRKVLLLAEREEAQAGFWETMEVGQDLSGAVKTLKPYGAFVNLGPIDGFLHIGEISWSRIAHPNEVLKEGQHVQVRVLKIDREKNRISLGMKQLVQNPWENLTEKYPSERIVNGRVSRIADFGAFVELEPGVEGLVHISELAWRRVGTVGEVLKVGDERDFKVLEVNQKRKRVSLSLKALEQKPESLKKTDRESESRPERKPNPDLRGGMGDSGAGGLFGNPKDFT